MYQAGSPEPARPACGPVLALLAPILLSACASPDWVDPNTWFADDPPKPQVVTAAEEGGEVPNLSTVPNAPPIPSPQVQRQAIAEGLAADRADARYSNQPLTVETTAVPEAAPPSANAPAPDAFSVAQVGESGDITSTSLAAPPPPSSPPTAATAGAAQPSAAAAQQPALLQARAYQQLAQQTAQTQQAAFQRQAFEQQARQRILEQRALRQQVIDQQTIQRRSLELQARQLAALGPIPAAPALAPQAFGQPAVGGTAPFPAAAPAYQSAPAYPAANVALGGGNLVAIIYFQHGSSGLSGRDREILRQVSSLAQQSGGGLQVIGHASARTGTVDSVRHRMANFNVSMQRANNVARALVSLGAPQERMSVDARSDSQPVYHEFMATGEAGNRRVEIYLTN